MNLGDKMEKRFKNYASLLSEVESELQHKKEILEKLVNEVKVLQDSEVHYWREMKKMLSSMTEEERSNILPFVPYQMIWLGLDDHLLEYKDVKETIVSLALDKKRIVVTSKESVNRIMKKVDDLKLSAYLHDVVYKEQTNFETKNRAFFQYMVSKYRLTSLNDVLVVGASDKEEIESANALGIDTCLLTRKKEEDIPATYQIDDIKKLVKR